MLYNKKLTILFKDHLTSTALGNVYDALKAEAKVVHGEGFDRYRESDEFAHEAGTSTQEKETSADASVTCLVAYIHQVLMRS